MGMTAGLIGGAILGLGSMFLGNKKSKTPEYSSSLINYQNAAASAPVTPEAPTTPTVDGEKKSEAMRLAEEEEKKKRAAEAEANKTNYTSGLGVTTPANVQRKTLLG